MRRLFIWFFWLAIALNAFAQVPSFRDFFGYDGITVNTQNNRVRIGGTSIINATNQFLTTNKVGNLAFSNWVDVVRASTNGVFVAAGTNVAVVTNVVGDQIIYTVSGTSVGGADTNWVYDGTLHPVSASTVDATNVSVWVKHIFKGAVISETRSRTLSHGTNTLNVTTNELLLLDSPTNNPASCVITLLPGVSSGQWLTLVNNSTTNGFTLYDTSTNDVSGDFISTNQGRGLVLRWIGYWIEIGRFDPGLPAPGAINPTDSFVPYRINASAFGDSRLRTNTIPGMQLNGGLWFYGIGATNAAITNRFSTETLDLVTGDGSSYGNLNLGQLWIHEQFLPQLNTASFAGAGHTVASLTVIQPVSAVLGTTNSVILDGTPTIPDGTSDGQIKWIVGRGNVTNTVTLQSESLFPGTNLRLEAPTRTLDRGNVLALLWDSVSSTWNEIGFSSGGIWLDVGGVYTPTSTNLFKIHPRGGVEIGTPSYGDPGIGLSIHTAMTNGLPGFSNLYVDAEGTNDIAVFTLTPTVVSPKQSQLAFYYLSNSVQSGSTFTSGPSFAKQVLYVDGLNYMEFEPNVANAAGSVAYRWDTPGGMSSATNAYAFRTSGTNRLAIAGDAVFPNDASYFFDGTGRWSVPGGGSSIWTNSATGIYKPNQATANALQFGSNALATARDSIVLGRDNTNAPSAVASTISGGTNNWILSNSVAATISGGANNFIDAGHFGATIGGGVGHQIDGGLGNFYGTIAGGFANRIQNTAQNGTIGGGQGHNIISDGGTIGGGGQNTVSTGSDYGTVSGGFNNIVGGDWSWIGGGSANITRGNGPLSGLASGIAAGYRNVIGSGISSGADYSFIGGGRTNTIPDVSHYGFIGGGSMNQVGGGGNAVQGNAIVGGFNNITEDLIDFAFIGGGVKNFAAGDWSAILGGVSNRTSAARAMAVGSFLTNETASSVETGFWNTKIRVDPSAFTVHNVPTILTNTLGGTQPVVRWVETNGTAYTQITVTNAGSTNNIVISLGPNTVAAGHVLKVHSTTISAGVNTIILTNDVDNSSGGGFAKTNLMFDIKFDGGGQPLATNLFAWFSCTNAMTITSWQIVGYPTNSSISVNVLKGPFATFPEGATSIAGTELPTLLNQTRNSDGTLSTWTTTVNPGDWFEARILNATNVQYAVISVYGF